MAREPSLAELSAEARHATARVALEEQRMYSGKGDPRRLAELKRVAAGAADRLARATRSATDGAPGGPSA
jgi:hypothetical protein